MWHRKHHNVLTIWPHIWFCRDWAIFEDLRCRPLDRKASLCWLAIRDEHRQGEVSHFHHIILCYQTVACSLQSNAKHYNVLIEQPKVKMLTVTQPACLFLFVPINGSIHLSICLFTYRSCFTYNKKWSRLWAVYAKKLYNLSCLVAITPVFVKYLMSSKTFHASQ